MINSEKDFLDDIKQQLNTSVADLDGETRSRLNQIRAQALDRHAPKPRPIRTWLWAGSAALPALVMGLLIYFGLPGQRPHDLQTEETPPPFELASTNTASVPIDSAGLGILMSEEELDMLADLDFLTWFGSEEEVGG